MFSRSPSPTKSTNRLALSSKDSNIRSSPNKKSLKCTPKLSPTKPRGSLSKSPSKSPSIKSGLSYHVKPTPSLGFEIYQDPKHYSTEMLLSSVKLSSDENDYTGNKENIRPKDSTPPNSSKNTRKPFTDRDIKTHPGYIEYTSAPRNQNLYQLHTLWNNSIIRDIPSYVTPPRNDRLKYISFATEQREKENPMKRSSSLNDFNSERVVKKLLFDIHKD